MERGRRCYRERAPEGEGLGCIRDSRLTKTIKDNARAFACSTSRVLSCLISREFRTLKKRSYAGPCHVVVSIISTTNTHDHHCSDMKRASYRKPSKLALTLSLFFIGSLASTTADATSSSIPVDRRSWKPDSELPGAKFVLGDGKNQGSKVKGYEGEWPLWSSFRKAQAGQSSSSGATSTNSSVSGSSNSTVHVCAPIGECEPCPDDVIHLPYCRPYNNRRRVACSPVTDRNNPEAVQAALDEAKAAKSGSNSTIRLGYEACGKSAKKEARDYFEMIAFIASIAIFSVWAFIQRQKLLFQRQNQQLLSRVTGRRRSSGVPTMARGGVAGALQGKRKKRNAKLAAAPR